MIDYCNASLTTSLKYVVIQYISGPFRITRVKNCAQIPARARNIALLYNACTRDINFGKLFCALIRRITGASARANYRLSTRITLCTHAYARAYRLRRLHSALAGVLAVAGYASPDNITSSRGVKHRQGPIFFGDSSRSV